MIADAILNRLAARLAGRLSPPRSALRPLVLDDYVAGLLNGERSRRIARFRDVFRANDNGIAFHDSLQDTAARTTALDAVVRQLAGEGALTPWRDERFAVAPDRDGALLFEIERSAARYFGIATHAAHVNATTTHEGTVGMWLARRSPRKAIDPGLLDNLVAGGIAAGATVRSTVIKEAREEAGIPENIASQAQGAGRLAIFREVPDGIQRETIHVHDLSLPPGFDPRNEDGEVAGFRLVEMAQAAEIAAHTTGDDVVTDDAALVVLDWLSRHGFVPAASAAHALLSGLRLRG